MVMPHGTVKLPYDVVTHPAHILGALCSGMPKSGFAYTRGPGPSNCGSGLGSFA